MAGFLYLWYEEVRTFRSTSYPRGITWIKPQRGAAPKGLKQANACFESILPSAPYIKKPVFMAGFLYLWYDEVRTFRSTSYPRGITWIKA
jgi:hypothetical protein